MWTKWQYAKFPRWCFEGYPIFPCTDLVFPGSTMSHACPRQPLGLGLRITRLSQTSLGLSISRWKTEPPQQTFNLYLPVPAPAVPQPVNIKKNAHSYMSVRILSLSLCSTNWLIHQSLDLSSSLQEPQEMERKLHDTTRKQSKAEDETWYTATGPFQSLQLLNIIGKKKAGEVS